MPVLRSRTPTGGALFGSNLRKRVSGSEVSAYLPITPFDPLASLEHYWTMSEATGATRVDSVGSNDVLVSTGPATQVAGHLGNASQDFIFDMTSGLTVGAAGYTFGWWEEAQNAGAPTVVGIWSLGGEGFGLISASPGMSNIQVSITGRPSGGGNSVIQNLPVAPEAWHFICIVVDSAGVTSYGGDDTGAALTVVTNAFAGGDSFVAPGAFNMDHSQPGVILDDMFQYSVPLSAANVAALYNGGAGVAIF